MTETEESEPRSSASSSFQDWVLGFSGTSIVKLFDADEDLTVRTHLRNGKELLIRSSEMEKAVVDLIECGLQKDDWCGLLYVMCWGTVDAIRPLYIGKANRRGRKAAVSANIRDIRRNRHKFARWGDGLDYHIGDLSQTLFGFEAYRGPTEKYRRWAEMLFVHKSPPRLREHTSLLLIPWYEASTGICGEQVDLEEAEEQAIEVAIAEFENLVLNVQGEVWWDQRASDAATPPSRHSDRPCTVITDESQLPAVQERLKRGSRVGLDVETEMYSQRLCLIQMAGESETFLIDALTVRNLAPLREILESLNITKIIHNSAFEKRILLAHDLQINGIYDTLKISRQRRGRETKNGHGLAAVCQRELGETVNKGEQTSNWMRRPLTKPQLDYAALDAEVLLRLHDAFEHNKPTGSLL